MKEIIKAAEETLLAPADLDGDKLADGFTKITWTGWIGRIFTRRNE